VGSETVWSLAGLLAVLGGAGATLSPAGTETAEEQVERRSAARLLLDLEKLMSRAEGDAHLKRALIDASAALGILAGMPERVRQLELELARLDGRRLQTMWLVATLGSLPGWFALFRAGW
jgi:hypothetical protein